jgi:hypothetical protein
MFLFQFKQSVWQQEKNFLPKNLWGTYCGGLGALMLVDYESSNVGSYQEILFIPGRFSNGSIRAYSISRIWVSTEASVEHGRKNWGIPKDLARFEIDRSTPRQEIWKVLSPSGGVFFTATLSFGRLPLPIHTKFLPMPLIQRWNDQNFLTKHEGFGWGRFASLRNLAVDTDIFPDISGAKPLVGFQIDPFRLHFPKAKMLELPLFHC